DCSVFRCCIFFFSWIRHPPSSTLFPYTTLFRSVIDYSWPNVTKPMHVGHLRSTIIGDSLARLFRFLGHRVVTDNHLGDWGTQFGILLYGYKHHLDKAAFELDPLRELARLYVLVREKIKLVDEEQLKELPEEEQRNIQTEKSPALAEARKILAEVREETAKLHAGDSENVRLWQEFMPWCRDEIDRIYRRLDVHFDHTHGESFYHPLLADVVRSLCERGLAEESQGAIVIPFGTGEMPAMIRKKDGAFTYTTSDLATIRYRVEQWHPDAILYVVDARQSLHFKNLFEAAG